MARINVLHQRKADLLKEADLLAAKDVDGVASEQDMERYGAILNADLPRVNGDIETEQRMMEARRGMAGITSESVDTESEIAARQAADKAQRFATFGEQIMAIYRAGPGGTAADQRLIPVSGATGMVAAATGMNESIGAEGGFLVQTDFQQELLQNMYEGGEILSRIRKIPISANANGLKFNGVDEASRANGSRWGGIQAYWTPEAGLKQASRPNFRQVEMTLKKLIGMCYTTDELLQDTTALESWIRQAFEDEFTFKLEDAILNGTGAGMPLGILNSGAAIVVAKEGGQANATITANNIIAMWARMPARSRKNAVWLVNVDTEPQLSQLFTLIKNVAGTENVGGIASVAVSYTPTGTNGSQYATLMGRPVIPVEYAATLGTPGDIILADLTQYLGIDKGGIQYATSMHLRFAYDESAFRFVYRFDGQPLWRIPVTPYKGTATQSPYIVLAQR